jgi:hypothetical protein
LKLIHNNMSTSYKGDIWWKLFMLSLEDMLVFIMVWV